MKCKVLHIGRLNPRYEYKMWDANGAESVVEAVEEEKDLGVTFDPSLQFSKHVNTVAKKGNKVLGAIRRGFEFLDSDVFTRLYKALVRPHLEYANCVWNPVLKRDIETLERVQHRATKLVLEEKDKPYEERLKDLNLPTLVYRRKRGDMIEVFKILRGIENIDSDLLFTRASYSATRGHEYKLFKKDVKLRMRHHCFSQRVVNEWNNLPRAVVSAKSVNDFKK
jgi:hypothetical protein